MHPQRINLTCKACGNNFSGNYCNKCGEKVITEHDKSLTHIAEEAFHFISHLDGTLINTLKVVFTKPGQLSVDYCYGIRKKYFKPFSFFLLLVVLYLVFPFFTSLNMPLGAHVNQDIYGGYAKTMVKQKLLDEHTDFALLQQKFEAHSEKVSKLLLIVIIPIYALLLWAGFFKKRRYFYDHFIFSAELCAFFLLSAFIVFPLLVKLLLLLPGLNSVFSENFYRIAILIIPLIYCLFAFRRFYKLGWIAAIITAIIFAILQLLIIFVLYRFIQFNVIMWLI